MNPSHREEAALAGFRARVRAGESVMGTFVKLRGLEPVDLASLGGFDFVVVDLEHSQLDAGDAALITRHCNAIGLPALVRIPTPDQGLVNHLLEAGAAGIQLSTVRAVRDAEQLHAVVRYPPDGIRSVSTAQPAAGYGQMPLADYLAASARDVPLVIGQIETATTEDPLDDIMPFLDVAFLGTADLSTDMGAPGDLTHPAVAERMHEVAAASQRHGVVLGGFAAGVPGAADLSVLGARYIVVGSDLQSLQQALAATAAALVLSRSR